MPITYRFVESCDLLETRAVPPVTVADLLKVGSEIGNDPRYHRGLKRLCDLSALDRIEISTEQTWALRDPDTGLGQYVAGGAIALVAPGDYLYGMTRMHMQILDDLPAEIEIFRDLESARAWLATR